METASTSKVRMLCLVVIVGVLSLGLESCVYRTYSHPASRERVRITGRSPDVSVVHVDTSNSVRHRFGIQQFDHVTDYQVPADGRVIVDIPAYRPSDGVYLFNWIKLLGGNGPEGTWTVTVSSGGRTARKLSVKQVKRLTTDADGYRLLKLPE